MPQTPNHGYNVPNEGAQDWHIPLNQNFRQYDTDIEIRDAAGNRGDYRPKQGAKFLASDTGAVYIGDGSGWNRIGTTGSTPTLSTLNPDSEFLGVARSSRVTPSEYFGIGTPASDDEYGGMYVDGEAGSRPFYGYSIGGDPRAWHYYHGGTEEWRLNVDGDAMRVTPSGGVGIGGSPAGNRLRVVPGSDDPFAVLAEGDVSVQGDLDVVGNKNFTQTVDTDDGEREVVYTATEAGTPHTEASGVAELEDGRAEIGLPDHFGWVTDDEEPLVVQTTPYGGTAGLKVVERSTGRLVVADLDGEGDYEFAYTVKGTREGYADEEVVREPSASGSDPAASDGVPEPADD
jgi:hypothetical protein